MILVTWLAVSCQKQDLLRPPALYHKSALMQVSPTLLFSRSGRITASWLLHDFESRDSDQLSQYANNLMNTKSFADSIKIIDAHHASIFHYTSYQDYSLRSVGNLYFFSAKDTTSEISYGDLFTHTAFYWIPLYKPAVWDENIYSSTRGIYLFTYRTQQQFIA